MSQFLLSKNAKALLLSAVAGVQIVGSDGLRVESKSDKEKEEECAKIDAQMEPWLVAAAQEAVAAEENLAKELERDVKKRLQDATNGIFPTESELPRWIKLLWRPSEAEKERQATWWTGFVPEARGAEERRLKKALEWGSGPDNFNKRRAELNSYTDQQSYLLNIEPANLPKDKQLPPIPRYRHCPLVSDFFALHSHLYTKVGLSKKVNKFYYMVGLNANGEPFGSPSEEKKFADLLASLNNDFKEAKKKMRGTTIKSTYFYTDELRVIVSEGKQNLLRANFIQPERLNAHNYAETCANIVVLLNERIEELGEGQTTPYEKITESEFCEDYSTSSKQSGSHSSNGSKLHGMQLRSDTCSKQTKPEASKKESSEMY
jgi:hypothetical protein